MTKKTINTIILILIFLIIINTFYWINMIADLSKDLLSSKLVRSIYFYNKEDAVKNIISLIAITDAVLIAISFMIILLYKKGVKNEIEIF